MVSWQGNGSWPSVPSVMTTVTNVIDEPRRIIRIIWYPRFLQFSALFDMFNPSRPSGYFMCHQVWHSTMRAVYLLSIMTRLPNHCCNDRRTLSCLSHPTIYNIEYFTSMVLRRTYVVGRIQKFLRLHVRCSAFLFDCNLECSFWTGFYKQFAIPNFKGIQPVGEALIHADKRTDGHDKTKTLYTTTWTLLKILRSAHTVYLCSVWI